MANWILSSFWYVGGLTAIVGMVCLVKPLARLRIRTRRLAASMTTVLAGS